MQGVEEIGDESSKFEIRTAPALWGEHDDCGLYQKVHKRKALCFSTKFEEPVRSAITPVNRELLRFRASLLRKVSRAGGR